jgi:hypothetical protein
MWFDLASALCESIDGVTCDTSIDTIGASTGSSPTVLVAIFIDLEDDD